MPCQHLSACACTLVTHQGSRDSWVSDQKVCVWASRYSHKSAHLLVEPEPMLGPLPRGGGSEIVPCKRPRMGLELCRSGGLDSKDSMRPMRRRGSSHAEINDESV